MYLQGQMKKYHMPITRRSRQLEFEDVEVDDLQRVESDDSLYSVNIPLVSCLLFNFVFLVLLIICVYQLENVAY